MKFLKRFLPSSDLFDRVVLQDGYALNSIWSFQEDNIDRSFRLAQGMGFKGTSKVGLLRFLKRQDPSDLVQACIDLRKEVQKVITLVHLDNNKIYLETNR